MLGFNQIFLEWSSLVQDILLGFIYTSDFYSIIVGKNASLGESAFPAHRDGSIHIETAWDIETAWVR